MFELQARMFLLQVLLKSVVLWLWIRIGILLAIKILGVPRPTRWRRAAPRPSHRCFRFAHCRVISLVLRFWTFSCPCPLLLTLKILFFLFRTGWLGKIYCCCPLFAVLGVYTVCPSRSSTSVRASDFLSWLPMLFVGWPVLYFNIN